MERDHLRHAREWNGKQRVVFGGCDSYVTTDRKACQYVRGLRNSAMAPEEPDDEE